MSENSLRDLFKDIQSMLLSMADSGVMDENDPLLSQSFVEGETFVPELIDGVLASIENDMILLAGIKEIVTEYNARKSRISKRIEEKKGMIELALIRADIPKLETPRATVSLRNVPRALASLEESEIPAEYFFQPPPKLDRKKLLNDMRAGKDVDGATLNNGGITLAVRRK